MAAWMLRGPLPTALAVLTAVQLLTWVPHYLTWPLWADHDVFATLARGWADGQLPYRDLRSNNFPGTIYLFSLLGACFGWGRSATFFAFDAALVVGFGALLLSWSRRTSGVILPGLVGYLTFLSDYLGLDYSLAAQRDWQGPCFMAAAVLLLQGWSGRAVRWISALAAAAAVTIRPQTVLLLPALLLALDENAGGPAGPLRPRLRAVAEWSAAFAALLAIGFAPLILAGVWGDFLRSLRLAGYGKAYDGARLIAIGREWLIQSSPLRYGVVGATIVLLNRRGDPNSRRGAWTWLAALAGTSLYAPVSPVPHPYLKQPLLIVWSINVAVLVRLILGYRRASPVLRLAAVLLTLGLGTTLRPEFCQVGASIRAVAGAGRAGDAPRPPGYRRGEVAPSASYPWRDYHAALAYLRHATGRGTRVANVLKGFAAITGPADRPTAFPAESVAWLWMVKPDDEAAFAEALERSPDSVVVWVPGEAGLDPAFTLERITAVIRRRYRPEARFGAIEVWRRKAE